MDTALLIEKLNNTHSLNKDEALQLIKQGAQHKNLLFALAQKTAQKSFGRQIFVRGLIEFTNYCKNDCYYCGIRRSNKNAARYRLTQEEILECCRAGYGLGFRTFVLQGGEDYFYSDEDIAAIVRAIKAQHPDCAVTLSIGERSRSVETSRRRPLSSAPRNCRLCALRQTAPGRTERPKPPELPVHFKRTRLSGRRWLYGWLTLPDGGKFSGRFNVPAKTAPADDWHRAFHPPS